MPVDGHLGSPRSRPRRAASAPPPARIWPPLGPGAATAGDPRSRSRCASHATPLWSALYCRHLLHYCCRKMTRRAAAQQQPARSHGECAQPEDLPRQQGDRLGPRSPLTRRQCDGSREPRVVLPAPSLIAVLVRSRPPAAPARPPAIRAGRVKTSARRAEPLSGTSRVAQERQRGRPKSGLQ